MKKSILALALPTVLLCSFQSRSHGADAGPAPAQADVSEQVPVTFTGGYETDPRDGGRPVILIASALKVTPDVFRNVFSNVHPSHNGGPTDEEARRNKRVLLDGLGPYGITNDRINEVSNYYRYARFHGEMWRTVPATAVATVSHGVVTGFTITNAGAGYSSPPQVTVAGVANLKAGVTLAFGTDFKQNGSIKEITLGDTGASASTVAAPEAVASPDIAVKNTDVRPQPQGGRQGGGGPVQRSVDRLKLSSEEMQKIEPLLRDYRTKELSLRNEVSEQLKQVLSPSQYEQFEAGLHQGPPPPRDENDRPAPPK